MRKARWLLFFCLWPAGAQDVPAAGFWAGGDGIGVVSGPERAGR